MRRVRRVTRRKLLVYVDGAFVSADKASVSVFDHGFLYGDGIFEGIAVNGSKAFMLDEHMNRMFNSARTIRLEIPLTKAQLRRAIKDTISKNGLVDGYVRPIISRGRGSLGLNPEYCEKATVVIIPQRTEDYPLLKIRRPARAIVSTVRRNPPFSIPASAKTLNYLNNILAKQQANAAGVDEAIMLDWTGKVSEGTGDNVFIVRHGIVCTPSLQHSILPGITRLAVRKLCERHGIPFRETELSPKDLHIADEVFLTSTSLGIQPLVEIDGRKVKDGKVGPVTRMLSRYLDEAMASHSELG